MNSHQAVQVGVESPVLVDAILFVLSASFHPLSRSEPRPCHLLSPLRSPRVVDCSGWAGDGGAGGFPFFLTGIENF